jgi:hypothetical protein
MLRPVSKGPGAAPIAIACLLALAGCDLGGDDEAPPARGAPREVAAVVRALESATRAHDWGRICSDLLTASARRRAGGRDCARLMRSSAGDLRRPRVQLVGIALREGGASVRVRTRASGQRPLTETLRLVRERGRYRIDALAD